MSGIRRLAIFNALLDLVDDDGYQLTESIDDGIFLLMSVSNKNKERQPAVRIIGYAEQVVPSYTDSVFRSHFRLSRQNAETVIRLLGACPGIPTVHRRGKPPVSVEKQLLLTLWVLGNPECLRSVSDRFNVTKSSVYRIVRRVCSALVDNCAKTFIRWPQGERAAEIMQKFEQNNGLPRCLGIVDGTHIPIKAPRVHPEQYVSRKKFHSLQLQAVCDCDRLFTDVYCAFPGSVHDPRVLRNSPLYKASENHESDMFPGDSYIIGDRAYPLKTWLITGFKDNGRLSREQNRFNFILFSKRIKVEHTIGLLKGRFRKLKVFMDLDLVEDIPLIVIAACVLHNFCMLNEDDVDDFLDPQHEDEINEFENIFGDPEEAVQKRAEIMEMVC